VGERGLAPRPHQQLKCRGGYRPSFTQGTVQCGWYESGIPDPGGSELAGTLAAGPTVALGLMKWLANTGYERSVRDQLAQEGLAMELSSRSPDFREGLAAFVEKRDPRFSGK